MNKIYSLHCMLMVFCIIQICNISAQEIKQLEIHTSGIFEDLKGNLLVGVGSYPGHIYKSSNGGEDWSILGNSVIIEAEQIVVNSYNHIFIAGNGGGIVASKDYGQSWEQLSLPYADIRALAIANNDYIYAGIDDNPPHYIARSTDNGETWEDITGIIPSPIYAINSYENNIIVGTGPPHGNVYISTNYGNNWEKSSLIEQYWITAISVDTSGNIFVGSEVKVFKSADMGCTWSEIYAEGGYVASIITSVNDFMFVATGLYHLSSKIYRSSDNGQTWIWSGWGMTGGHIWKMIHSSDNSLYVSTKDEGIFKSTNLGDEWFSVGPLTAIDNNNLLQIEYELSQNHPNPFNPVTTIRYELPQDGVVTIDIYDILGQRVRIILNKFQKANRYEVEFSAIGLASGVYIYRMKVNDFIESKKMILLK